MIIRKKLGFTLIELSIVLVIVGLLVGGMLVGRDLIDAAQSRALIKQMQDIQLAVRVFKDKYNCIPGDCAKAADFGLGTSGNGDKYVGSITSIYTSAGGCLTGSSIGTCIAMGEYAGGHTGFQVYRLWGELQRFWVHLANAGMIKEDVSEMASSATSISLNDYFPKDAAGKANLIVFMWNHKLYVRTGFANSGAVNATSGAQFRTAALNSAQMSYIHTKMGYHEIIVETTAQDYPLAMQQGQRVIPVDLCTFSWCTDGYKAPVYVKPGWTTGTGSSLYNERCAVYDSGTGTYNFSVGVPGNCNFLWRIDY